VKGDLLSAAGDEEKVVDEGDRTSLRRWDDVAVHEPLGIRASVCPDGP
jgi:hypothetical protein